MLLIAEFCILYPQSENQQVDPGAVYGEPWTIYEEKSARKGYHST